MRYQISNDHRLLSPSGIQLIIGMPESRPEILKHPDFVGLNTSNTSVSTSVRTSSSDRPQAHGQIMGRALLSGTTVSISILVLETDTARRADLFDRVRSLAYEGLSSGLSLTWMEANGKYKELRGLQTVGDPQIKPWNGDGYAKEVLLQLASETPFITGQPTSIESLESGTFRLPNDGNAPAMPTFWVYGPCTSFSIENMTSGEAVGVSHALADREWIKVDCRTASVLKNGSINVYDAVDYTSNEFFQLQPGDNEVQFLAEGATDDTKIRADFRPTWW